jgi:hypothetical protein
MKLITKTLVVVSALLLLVGCKKEDPLTPQQMLEGKWIIQSQEMLGSVVQGDGSYLQFNACSSSCDGVDYKAGDQTTGVITYTLNSEATVLSITDNSADGGSWDADWDILELTETDLRITTSTAFGNVKVEMTK